jgi:hypothetical protein
LAKPEFSKLNCSLTFVKEGQGSEGSEMRGSEESEVKKVK